MKNERYCEDCKCEVEGILYNDMVTPNIYICEDCGQFIGKQPTLGERLFIDNIASFVAWLVDNHEDVFVGGEDQIAKLCSDFVKYDEAKRKA